MARFNVVGLEEFDKLREGYLALAEDIKGEATDKALTAGGERLGEYFRGTIVQKKHIKSGQLLDSIKSTKPGGEGDKRHVDVYPQGTRDDGFRNAEIGAYLEYGVKRVPPKKSIPASHWMSDTVDDTREDVQDIMEEKINEAIDKHLK